MRRPLGCLTGTALITAFLATVLFVGLAAATGGAIFSPGTLNAATTGDPVGGIHAHADLAGRCDACHAQPGSGVRMADKCLACHSSVKTELDTNGGFHGRFATTDECRSCHTDHRGTDASLTLADPTGFPHEKTGFALVTHPVSGAGGRFHCADCHTTTVTRFTAQTCAGCHTERDATFMASHTEAFGSDCRTCHDGLDTYGHTFNHETWPLSGKHAEASCAACHKGSTTPAALRSTPTTCVACHQQDDVHKGRMGTECQSCHNSRTWTEAAFDHSTTRFALTGRHMQVECLKCHVNRQWTGLGTTCEACHSVDDPHNGQFAQGCASCHATSDWHDITFDHATTGFKLAGAHLRAACSSCHANGRYKGTPTTCVACHKQDDAHDGALGSDCARCHTATTWQDTTFNHDSTGYKLVASHAKAACRACHVGNVFKGTSTKCVSCHRGDDKHNGTLGTNCAVCHKPTTWADTTFDHDTTAFKLTGAHTSAACRSCHVGGVYKGTPTTCYACHKADDKHNGQYGTNCASCHTTRSWSGATFDHSRTAFPLVASHRTVACAACHVGGIYKGTPTTCYACHKADDAHNGTNGTNCATCHTPTTWGNVSFNHAATRFPLTGAHTGVACASCHKNNVYTGTPTSCSACHTKPSTHQPSAFLNCASCHTTTAWRPATFNATHTFPRSHGGAGGVCTTCHAASWASYSCARCHSNSSMTSHHSGISNFTLTTCAVCHPTGRNP